jgi:hypothetical protein
MQHTLAFAPTEEDLQDFFFDVPVITLGTSTEKTEAAEEPPEPDAAQAS